MKKMIVISVSLLFGTLIRFASLPLPVLQAQRQARRIDYPEPRYPKVTKITSLEELLPAARFIVTKPKNLNMRPGYGIKGGERVLFLSDNIIDPLVVEAFVTALREKGCKVDVWS